MKIICIGRNYKDHAAEMNSPVPSKPMFFMKPETSVHNNNLPYYLPTFTKDLHYELEITLRIDKMGKHIPENKALSHVGSIGLGIDFTARDIQQQCKEKGHPWEVAKAFDGSAILSRNFLPFDAEMLDKGISLRLEQNGQTVQDGSSKQMLFDCAHLISYVSKFVTLKKGDMIMTGTPAGVGPVKQGDNLKGYFNNELLIDLNIK